MRMDTINERAVGRRPKTSAETARDAYAVGAAATGAVDRNAAMCFAVSV
jgi:hypothetical protein